MSSTWASLFIPLTKGLDLSQEATLGQDELHTALNVDYPVVGRVSGRPSRATPKQFAVRTDPTTHAADAAFDDTGLTPRGLMRLRDMAGERVALGTEGRLFTQEGTRWNDRGPFACARVDRYAALSSNNTSTVRRTATSDFGLKRSSYAALALTAYFDLFDSSGALQRQVNVQWNVAGVTTVSQGNGARCGTTTALVLGSSDDVLHFFYRQNGGDTVTRVELATDYRSPSDNGEAPVICCSRDGANFWVAYRTTTAETFKVLNVSTTGVVNATYTSAAVGGLHGLWIDNTTVAGNQVVVAFTHTTGITIRTLNATTMADLSVDSSHDGSDGAGTVGLDVVVGCESDSRCWWAYRNSNAVGDGDIVLGYATPGTAGTATRHKKFWGGDSYTNAAIRWAMAHQPVYHNGRCYLTLVAARGRTTTGTWITIDLSNLTSLGQQVLVARGATEGTFPALQPSAAVPLSSGGWVFPTFDWSRFELNSEGSAVTGLQGSIGLNKVTMSGPRTASLGSTTVFSGSIPHMVAGGDCVELGFPFLGGTPGLDVEASAGGAVGIGDYGVVVCWRWTDESGQIHRSAPSAIRTCTTSSGNNTIRAVVSNPWLTEKSDVVIEVYTTDLDPTDDSLHYLQTTASVNTAAAYTTVDITTQPITTTEAVYTDSDELANYHVPGDGGVAAVGRRLWMADASRIYASKLHVYGYGPGFNDVATADLPSLYLQLPAAAGRIVALEALDDKLVVFGERGVYLVQDGGPDNTGSGADFAPPVRLSDLAIAGPRSSCSTDAGVLFCSTLDSTDASRGGPWLLDRQFTFTERQYLGRQALDFHLRTSNWVPEVAYSPERQQAYITTNVANGSSHGVVVIDMRVSKWAVWDTRSATAGDLQSIAVVNGALWALNDEPAPFDGTPGTDAVLGDYAMTLKTAHIAGNGQDGLGWARVRGVNPHGGESGGAHTLTMTAVLDGTRTHTSSAVAVAAPSADTTWPSSRQDPEWRLPSQKCSTIQVQLSATPANARWAAIRLEVAPLPRRAPAKNRS